MRHDLRTVRAQLGLTQAQLAAVLGTTANTVARWERGELEVARPAMLDLAIEALARHLVVPAEGADGPRVRAARLAAGLAQADLAAFLGVETGTVNRWERGRLAIERPRLVALALAALEARAAARDRASA